MNLNKSNYKSYIQVINQTISETKKRIAMLPEYEWVAKLTYEQWVDYNEGKLKTFDPLSIEDIRNQREFNYYFSKGEFVMLDESVMNKQEKEKYSELIGSHAIVTNSSSDLHSFGRGSHYSHHVKFENGYETKPCGCAFPDIIPCFLLILAPEEAVKTYLEQYKNTEDKTSLWYYIEK
jgi:hypothetical protein